MSFRPDFFSPTLLSTNSLLMDSDNSTRMVLTLFLTLITLDEFLDSEPSPSTFSQAPFQPLNSQLSNESSPVPSTYTDATPFLSLMSSDQTDPPSTMTDKKLEHELDNFITLQQHIHNTTNTLTIHQLTHSTSISESSI